MPKKSNMQKRKSSQVKRRVVSEPTQQKQLAQQIHDWFLETQAQDLTSEEVSGTIATQIPSLMRLVEMSTPAQLEWLGELYEGVHFLVTAMVTLIEGV